MDAIVGDDCVGIPLFIRRGGRYDPAADSWIPTSTGANVPMARSAHTAVLTGTEMIVWGGREPVGRNAAFLNTGGRYDPVSNTWVPTSRGQTVPAARAEVEWGGLRPPAFPRGWWAVPALPDTFP